MSYMVSPYRPTPTNLDNEEDACASKNAATTFTTAMIRAGLMPVRDLGLKFCGINIVSTTIDSKYGHAQRQAAQGLYVLTHSSVPLLYEMRRMKPDF